MPLKQNSKIRLTLVISSLGVGGEQRASSIITKELCRRGMDVSVLSFAKAEKVIEYGPQVNVTVVPVNNNLKKICAIREHIKQDQSNIAIGFGVIPSVLCSLASVFTKTKTVVCERNDPDVYHWTWKLMRAIAYKFAFGAVFQTTDASACFSEHYFKKRTVIRNPLNLDDMPQPFSGERRKDIVNFSRLVPAKRQADLIKAFAALADTYPQYTVSFYGDGTCKEKLIATAQELGVAQKVRFYPAVKDIWERIKDASVFVLTSDHEGFPNTLAEAMALGLAPVSTNCRIGGPKDMIEHGVNGFLYEVGNVEELKQALQTLLEDEQKIRAVSQNAIAIRQKLDASMVGEEWCSFLKEAVKGA